MNKVIYAIKDIRTDKVIYIGQTKQFERRKQHHWRDNIQHVDRYITEEGTNNFDMYVLEEINDPNVKILELENHYIQLYNTIEEGFNRHLSGGSQSKYKKDQRHTNVEERKIYNADPDVIKQKAHEYYQKWKNSDKHTERLDKIKEKYHNELKNDEEYMRIQRENSSKYYYKNIEKKREYQREYARAKRAAQKANKYQNEPVTK